MLKQQYDEFNAVDLLKARPQLQSDGYADAVSSSAAAAHGVGGSTHSTAGGGAAGGGGGAKSIAQAETVILNRRDRRKQAAAGVLPGTAGASLAIPGAGAPATPGAGALGAAKAPKYNAPAPMSTAAIHKQMAEVKRYDY
jgi:hypothetical protein